MTSIATEDDLWKLFFEKPKTHTKPGEGYILWETLNQVLSAKSFGNGAQALKLDCEDRFYHVIGSAQRKSHSHAVVRQCDLRAIARSLNGSGGDTMIGYLGTSAELNCRQPPRLR